ncbi:MAG: diacylglycerol kinase family lipid kinase [Desulfarculaceae bacterium]|nr:diacylglycerol kinase family lipid kinase [Desulfarculaceae bacterium]
MTAPNAASMCLIHNPQAGRGKAGRATARLQQALAQAGLEPEMLGTRGRGHAEDLARQAVERGVETVIVVGGDGTMHEAAQALAHSDAALAPLPCGRCNDFCRALGVGRDPEGLVKALAGGGRRTVDLARVNGRVYCTVGAVGFDAVVSRYVDTMKAPLWGTPAYLYAVMRMITRYQPPQATVVWDDGEYHGPLFLVALGNTPSYGNNIRVTPHAVPDDGLLDICLVTPLSLLKVMAVLPLALPGKHGRVAEVSFLRSSKIELSFDRPMELWADGEPVTGSPFSVEILPGALTVAGAAS